MASDIPSTSGVYRITCTVTGKFYIGSTVNLSKRTYEHARLLRRGTHVNPKLQSAWNKYGEQAFAFETLELVLLPFLLEREQYWIDKLKPFFNIATSAQSARLGIKHRPESIAKMSINRRGYRPHNFGKKQSPESNEKNRQAHLGKEVPLESRQKMSQSRIGNKINLGRKHAPEVYASRMKTIIVTSPDGDEYLVTGVQRFCKEHDLDCAHLLKVAKGIKSQHKGWKARFP